MVTATDALAPYQALYQRALELTGNRADAEDLVQQTYLRMSEAPPRTLDPAEFLHWMRKTLQNLWIDGKRKHPLEIVALPTASDEEWDGMSCLVCGSHDARCPCCG